MDWSGVDYLRIIVMFLSAVWTLILTAPIHCRWSIAEQVMECYISPNLNEWMNEWMMHLYSAFIVYCHTPKALYNHVGGLSSTTTSSDQETNSTVVNICSGSKPFIKVVLKPKCVLVLGQLWWTSNVDYCASRMAWGWAQFSGKLWFLGELFLKEIKI